MSVVAAPPYGAPLGLSSAEADAALRRNGTNEIDTGRRFRLLREGPGMLANPLVDILLVAAIISGEKYERPAPQVTEGPVALSPKV